MEVYVHNQKEATYNKNPTTSTLVNPKSDNCLRNDYLPDWFLEEVISRLPVKCVFRYKCVSKRWRSFISHPSFACLYISRASLLPELVPCTILANTLHVKGVDSLAESLNLFSDLHPRLSMLHFPGFVSPEGEGYTILAVSDGLALYGKPVDMEYCYNDMREYRIYNAITGQWISLPPPSMCFGYVSSGFLTQTEGVSLKYFTVVRFDCQFGESYILKFEVFSSETGKWRSVVLHTDRAMEIVWLRRPVAFNGNLHWIDRRHGIMAFNPWNNQHRLICLPVDIDKQCNEARNNGKPSLCDAHQGRLRYIEASLAFSYPFGFSGFSIWILDNSAARWTLQHRVKVRDLLFDDMLLSRGLSRLIPTPIAFHPLDPNFVYLGLGDTIVSYNTNTSKLDALANPLEYQDEARSSTRNPCWMSTFFFMLPSWPIAISSQSTK